MKKIVIISLILVLVFFGAWYSWGVYTQWISKKIPYIVITKLSDNVEIREYDDLLIANTKMKTHNEGFKKIAGYIFGDNVENKEISMTTPVMVDSLSEGEMSFFMPVDIKEEKLPKPNDVEVDIKKIKKRRLAVIRFSGYVERKQYKDKLNRLQKILKMKNIAYKGKAYIFYYNDPWTMPFLRRNEIALEIN